jgi:TrmH family RNA methyltransferase
MNAYAERVSGSAMSGLLADKLSKGRGGSSPGASCPWSRKWARQIGLSFYARWLDAMNARTVTSLANATVKAVRALHLRKERDESGPLRGRGPEDRHRGDRLRPRAPHPHVRPRRRRSSDDAKGHPGYGRRPRRGDRGHREILAKVSRRDNPQAVVGVFDQVFTPLSAIDPAAAPCWVALHRVRDPGNLGTIVRTADAAGCGGVILVGECCDPYSVEGVRATMGSIFAVKIARADEAEFPPGARAGPVRWSAPCSAPRSTTARPNTASPPSILMGNEQQGLTPDLAALCDVNVKIPMRGRADSLNLSVATGIMIYAAT